MKVSLKRISTRGKVIALTITAVALIIGVIAVPRTPVLKIATTSSLYDTGLWAYLEPVFEQQHGVRFQIFYAGTGMALEYGMRGDVDAIAIHDMAREEQFVAQGYGVERIPFAYNYFLIVGPENDPARITGLEPEDAFKKLMDEGSEHPDRIVFVSRGDDSGTHGREKAIWQAAGFPYHEVQESGWSKARDGYVEAARGMGPTLLMANEKGAYTLTDSGTFLAYKGNLDLVPVVEEGAMLLNVYSVIAINPDRHPRTNAEMAGKLVEFLTSPEVQDLIGSYGVAEYGVSLFSPCAGQEPGMC